MKNPGFLLLSLSQDFNQVIQESWEEIVRNHINRLISKVQLSDPTNTAASPKWPIPPGTSLTLSGGPWHLALWAQSLSGGSVAGGVEPDGGSEAIWEAAQEGSTTLLSLSAIPRTFYDNLLLRRDCSTASCTAFWKIFKARKCKESSFLLRTCICFLGLP